MQTDKLIDQLELYGNAVCGFFIVQSIGFAYTLGTSSTFRCFAFIESKLNFWLAVHFAGSGVAAVLALAFISRSIRRLSSENQRLVWKLHIGKMLAVAAFVALPIGLLILYGRAPTLTLEACLSMGSK